MFLIYFIIIDEALLAILLAYISLARHIRRGAQIGRFFESGLCTAVNCQQFRKESRKRQRRIMFERNYSFFSIIVCCLVIT